MALRDVELLQPLQVDATPLIVSAKWGYVDAVRALLDAGANRNATTKVRK